MLKININSSRIPTYYLEVHNGNAICFSGIMHSSEQIAINISAETEYLEFCWHYPLSQKELMLFGDDIEQSDCVGSALYPRTNKTVFDTWFESMDKTEMGVYKTVISNIPNEIQELDVVFRGTKMNQFAPVLDVANPDYEDCFEIFFERNKCVENVISTAEKSKKKYLLFRIIECLILLLVITLFEAFYRKVFIVYPLILVFWKEIYAAKKGLSHRKDFIHNIKGIKKFKETPDEVIVLETE